MNERNLDPKALFKIGYGLYVVTTRTEDGRDNGLIVNTVCQLTDTPKRVGVTVNKNNYSHDLIRSTGILNVNCLTEDAPFSVFERFGFSSGRNTDKLAGLTPRRSANGLAVLPRYINSYLSLRVDEYVDLGTHGMFICSVTEAEVCSEGESMTYAYYHKNVKPKPQASVSKPKGYICTVCGFIHDEDTLPEDFVCPICQHGRDAFEEIK